MSADEMFKKMGYKKEDVKDKFSRIWGSRYVDSQAYTEIHFDYIDKEVCVTAIEDDEAVYFNMQELQAINKKVEELGWV